MRHSSAVFVLAILVAATSACTAQAPAPAPAAPAAPAPSPAERGQYLVTVGGCDDCHTPKTFGPEGMKMDLTRRLSGHPASDTLPPTPAGVLGPDKFGGLVNAHLTAWVGPWGTSFSRNLTPDQATGLGSWTEEMFLNAIRTGKHQGEGRAILPPMPWENYRQMTDEDLKAIWAFLRTLPPVDNAIPDPLPPPAPPK